MWVADSNVGVAYSCATLEGIDTSRNRGVGIARQLSTSPKPDFVANTGNIGVNIKR